jgi:hypothetical protein
MQTSRHDEDGNAFTNDFVLNRLAEMGGKETLEESKNLRTGKILPGKKGRSQVLGVRSQEKLRRAFLRPDT